MGCLRTGIGQRDGGGIFVAEGAAEGRDGDEADGAEAAEDHAVEDGGFGVAGPAEVADGVGEEGEVSGGGGGHFCEVACWVASWVAKLLMGEEGRVVW